MLPDRTKKWLATRSCRLHSGSGAGIWEILALARLAIGTCVIFVGACSTAPYKGAVEKFAEATTTATAAADTELTSTIADTRTDAAVAGQLQLQGLKWQLTKSPQCDQLLLPEAARPSPFDTMTDAELVAGCNLSQVGEPSNTVVAKFDADLDRAKVAEARKIAGALAGYVDGLSMIVNAEDYEALRKATSKMGSSLASVAALAGPYGVAAGAVIKPVAQIAGEVGIYGFEHRRWRLMRTVVPETDPAIASVSTELDSALRALRLTRLAAANSVMTSTQLAWNQGVRDKATSRAVTDSVLRYRELARFAQRPFPFSKVKAAHAALVEVVENDAADEQLEDFFSRLGELESAAEELKAAIDGLGGF